MPTDASSHAREMAKLGASKGGRVRAARLSAADRSEIARRAAETRWGSKLPRATHAGKLVIADKEVECAVLDDRRRVLTQGTFLTAIGRAEKAKGGQGSVKLVEGVPPFLAAGNLKAFIPDNIREIIVPVTFRTVSGGKAYGYRAELLPEICDIYLSARDSGAIHPSQLHIVAACDVLMRGLARVGIIALVDEATGYQEERAKRELQKILEEYISPELLPWTKRFPDEFFKQLYRLQGWEYRPGSAKRTPYVGKLINKYVYEQLPDGVLPELRRLNPVSDNGRRRWKHHQYLTADTGNQHLDRQITAVTTIMRISRNRHEFEELFARGFSQTFQERLPLVVHQDGTIKVNESS